MKQVLKNAAVAVVTSLVLAIPLNAVSQERGKMDKAQHKERKEKIEALKKEYIEKELALTDTEKQKFWPIYDELHAKLKEQRKKELEIGRDLRDNFESYSDTEVKTKTDAIFASESAVIQLKKEYLQKYAAVIGQKRATKVLHLEREFKKELMRRMREEHPDGARPPMPPMDDDE